MSSDPDARASAISESEKLPATTYSPMTAASMISPPTRLYSRNFTAAYDRWAAAFSSLPAWARSPKPPMRKYIGMSIASNRM
jgi:hypothetical protein